MRYLLDTNIVIASMKGLPDIRARLERTPVTSLVMSPIVLGELRFGADNSSQPETNHARLALLLQSMQLVPLDDATSRYYGQLRAALERRGTPIGSNDYWIAAHAIALGATLVTDNVREFSRVPGLTLENWLQR